MVLFHVERRKGWCMMQSRAGIAREDYAAQKALLGKLEKGELTRDDLLERGAALINEEIAAAKA